MLVTRGKLEHPSTFCCIERVERRDAGRQGFDQQRAFHLTIDQVHALHPVAASADRHSEHRLHGSVALIEAFRHQP